MDENDVSVLISGIDEKRLKCYLCNRRKKMHEVEEHVEKCKIIWEAK
jgi:hypothetical protein